MFLNIGSFLPNVMRIEHPSINEVMFGVMLSMYNVARLLFSVPIGATNNFVGRKNYILIGFAFLITSTAGFGVIKYIEHDQLYYWIAFLLRFMQGIGGTCLQVTSFSIVLREYGPKTKQIGLG